jgi:hypothetical protein
VILSRWVKNYKIFTLKKNFFIKTGITGVNYEEKYVIFQEDGRLLIMAGYQWNGCSPKFNLFDMVIGPQKGH